MSVYRILLGNSRGVRGIVTGVENEITWWNLVGAACFGDKQGTVKTVAIVYDQPSLDASVADLDVLNEVKLLTGALSELGYAVVTLPFVASLAYLKEHLTNASVSFVFNLVESVEGKGRHAYLFPALLEVLGIEYCGCSPFSLMTASNKLNAKEMMAAASIPTARWCTLDDNEQFRPGGRYILKCIDEDASLGLDDSSLVFPETAEALREALRQRGERNNLRLFAEEYLDGREFDLGIVGPAKTPHLFPVVERTFHHFEAHGKPRICNFAAKWDKDSFEYQNIQRRELDVSENQVLVQRLIELGLRCWNLFRGEGFMRIDFRSDTKGEAYVLDVNPNPCLALDSTLVFSASLRESYVGLIRRIVEARHA